MNITETDILELKKSLLPTGRAFKVPNEGNFEKLLLSKSTEELTTINAALSILESIIPDNDNFTDEDATIWENRIGVIKGADLQLRKKAILAKMAFPGTIKNRQNKKYLEYRLQQAGFNCEVWEIQDVGLGEVICLRNGLDLSDETELNGSDVSEYIGFIANRLYQNEEAEVSFSALLKPTSFYITGSNQGFFSINENSEMEFRRLVMSIKPLHTVALLKGVFSPSVPLVAMSGEGLEYMDGDTIALMQ